MSSPGSSTTGRQRVEIGGPHGHGAQASRAAVAGFFIERSPLLPRIAMRSRLPMSEGIPHRGTAA